MKILLYGDSNIWGNDASNLDTSSGVFHRFPRKKRIVGVMEELLPGCEIIEEALCGRTTCLSEPTAPFRNGMNYFPACLHSHEPLHPPVRRMMFILPRRAQGGLG